MFYNLQQHIFDYLYVRYIARQTVGPNWLTFFEKTHGYLAGNIGLRNPKFSQNSTRKAGHLLHMVN